MYSIGEVAKMFNLSISTLRFYDKEGLLLDLKRDSSGIRKFDENTIEALKVIECLKISGMQIKDIKEFMKWCSQGNSTLKLRKEMFLKQRENIEKEIRELKKALNMIKFKCWYYNEAEKDKEETRVKEMIPDHLPAEMKVLYDQIHSS